MGERDELVEQGIRALSDKFGFAPAGSHQGMGALVDAGWRPPAPAGEHAVSLVAQALNGELEAESADLCDRWGTGFSPERRADLLRHLADAAAKAMPRPEPAGPLFEGTVTSDGTSPVKVMVHWRPDVHVPDAGTEVAVYRKGDVPGPAPTVKSVCGTAPCSFPQPDDSPADLREAVDRAADHLVEVRGVTILNQDRQHLAAHLSAQGATIPPRPKSDPERLRDLFDDTAGVRASVDQCRVLLDTGLALLPEPKVRWTVDGYDVLDDEADVVVAASCSNRALAERIARLLNEEDEADG